MCQNSQVSQQQLYKEISSLFIIGIIKVYKIGKICDWPNYLYIYVWYIIHSTILACRKLLCSIHTIVLTYLTNLVRNFQEIYLTMRHVLLAIIGEHLISLQYPAEELSVY